MEAIESTNQLGWHIYWRP